MKNIAIFGCGGFGREVATLIEEINRHKKTYNIIGFFDDAVSANTIINGYPILGGINELNKWKGKLSLAIAIGTPTIKVDILSKIINTNIDFPALIHPSVIIGNSNYVTIGRGCIICAYSVITVNVQISDFVILNLGCTVGHDTIIGAYSAFMPSVNISGEVNIKEGVYVGTGAKIINQITIGEKTIIGAGAVVAKNLPSNCTAVGVPARVIK